MSELAAKSRPAINLDDFERRLRMEPPSKGADEDPLSELARLVGQDDPFKSIFSELSRPGQVKRSNHIAVHPARPELVRADPPMLPMQSHQAEAAGIANQQTAETSEYLDAPRLAPAAPAVHKFEREFAEPSRDANAQRDAGHFQAGETEDYAGADMPAPPRAFWPRKSLIAAAALCSVAVIGVGAAMTMRSSPGTEVARVAPTIKAVEGPAKVAAQAPASDAARQSPSILDKVSEDKPGQAKVVSREEQPVDLAQQPKTVRTLRVGGDGKPIAADAPASSIAAVASAAPAPAAAVPLSEPKKVKTVLVRPDGSVISNAAPAVPAVSLPQLAAPAINSGQTPSPKIADAAAAKTAAAATVPVPPKATARVVAPPAKPEAQKTIADAADANAPLQIAALAAAPKPSQKTASRPVASTAQGENDAGVQTPVAATAATAPAAEEPVQTTSSTGGSFAVQLAAPPSEAEAKATAARMQKQYAGALGDYRPSVRKATDKDVYRVRVGNLSKAEADSLCGKLKASGGPCFVAKN